MNVITVDCGAELAVALGGREADVEKEIRLASALKLFEMGRISSGLAAKLAGMSRVEFLMMCGRYGVSIFQQTEDEVQSDVQNVLETTT
jgi:predicted HTH domain antitoxin